MKKRFEQLKIKAERKRMEDNLKAERKKMEDDLKEMQEQVQLVLFEQELVQFKFQILKQLISPEVVLDV